MSTTYRIFDWDRAAKIISMTDCDKACIVASNKESLTSLSWIPLIIFEDGYIINSEFLTYSKHDDFKLLIYKDNDYLEFECQIKYNAEPCICKQESCKRWPESAINIIDGLKKKNKPVKTSKFKFLENLF